MGKTNRSSEAFKQNREMLHCDRTSQILKLGLSIEREKSAKQFALGVNEWLQK